MYFTNALALQLFSALGNNTSTGVPFITNVVAVHSSGTLFVGGQFTLSSGPANVVAFKGNALTGRASGGLNSPINALAISGDSIHVGGAFVNMPSGTGSGPFRSVVQYDIQQDKWNALLVGVSLNVANGRVDVAGNFTQLPSSPNSASGATAGGFATWDIGNGTWVNSRGFLSGNMVLVVNGMGSAAEFPTGSVTAARQFGADGFVMTFNGNQDNGDPTIKPLGVQLNTTVASLSTASRCRRTRQTSWLGLLTFL